MCVRSLSHVWFFVTPWSVAPQAPLSIRFLSDKNTIVGCHFLLQGIFSTQQSNLHILHWQVGSLTLGHLGNPLIEYNQHPYKKGRFGHRAWHRRKIIWRHTRNMWCKGKGRDRLRQLEVSSKDYLPPSGARKRQGRILPRVSEGAWSWQHLIFRYLASRAVRQYIVVLSHLICGALLWQS